MNLNTRAQRALAALGAHVLQRDWLSSNQIVFPAVGGQGATVVDTGYDSHGSHTVQLVEHLLAGQRLGQIVNTHLHADHCGGNAHLQARHGCVTRVPAPSFEAVRQWDESALSFNELDQRCQRFHAEEALVPGAALRLGEADWQVLPAPGHDPDAVMLFEPTERVLISGDALWEHNVAIIFPELEGQPGFSVALDTLAAIEALAPQVVVPGHGPAFGDVAAALARSRARLNAFQAEPARHLRYALRALVMFRMLSLRRLPRVELLGWMQSTPLFQRLGPNVDAQATLEGLLRDGNLQETHLHDITLP
jgi:glyoxylase-like metal-dependent hydrolase (beta-lactamase superfamily II)